MKSTLTLSVLAASAIVLSAGEPVTLKLWPQGAPEPAGFKSEPEKEMPPKDAKDVKRVTNVTEPTITV